MEHNQDDTEVLETPVVEIETTETSEPTPTPEEIAGWKAKAAEADELASKNKQLFERLEKAKAQAPSKTTGELSSKDILFLAQNPVHEEDIDTVLDWAKFKKIPVTEAYKQMKSVLDVNAETRKSAEAINTKGGARGTAKVSPADLLAAASRNEDIDPTDENYNAIFQARLARKLRKRG